MTTAIDAVRNVHGGYQAIDLLTKAMSGVETPEDFDREVEEAERAADLRYEGPDEAIRSTLKTLETAANESGQTRSALEQLLALVLVRLGSMQGAKVLVGLLKVAGMKPMLAAVLIRVLLLLVQSETGRSIVSRAWPKIQSTLGAMWANKELQGSLREFAQQLGQQGSHWMESVISKAPPKAVDAVKNVSDSLLDGLENIFLAKPVGDPPQNSSPKQPPKPGPLDDGS